MSLGDAADREWRLQTESELGPSRRPTVSFRSAKGGPMVSTPVPLHFICCGKLRMQLILSTYDTKHILATRISTSAAEQAPEETHVAGVGMPSTPALYSSLRQMKIRRQCLRCVPIMIIIFDLSPTVPHCFSRIRVSSISMPTSPGAPILTRLMRAELLALMKRLRPKPMSSVNDSRADRNPVSGENECQIRAQVDQHDHSAAAMHRHPPGHAAMSCGNICSDMLWRATSNLQST